MCGNPIDKAREEIENVGKSIEREVSNLGKGIEHNVQQVGKGIEKGAQELGKNIERSGANILQGTAMLASGNWNNADRVLFDMLATYMTGGAYLAANPDDVGNAIGKETAVERFTSEVKAEAVAEQERQARVAEEARLAKAASAVDEMIMSRIRRPGTSQTLLTDTKSKTLLTRA